MEFIAYDLLSPIIAGGTASGVTIAAVVTVFKVKLSAVEKRLEITIKHCEKTLDRINERLDHLDDKISEKVTECHRRIDGMRDL